MNNKKKCLIIDGNNLVHRSYHASKKLTWIEENKEIYVFLKIFFSILKKEDYNKLLITFDGGKETFRNKINRDYKANRKKNPDLLVKHLEEVKKLIIESGLNYSISKKFEADDIIASFIKKFKNETEYEFHIFSQDKDLFQLLSENVKILRYNKGKLEKFGPEEFIKLNGFCHKNFLYYLSLTGDKVDNIKGIEGIGEKRGKYIVSTFKNVENTFSNINLMKKEIKILLDEKKEKIIDNMRIISLSEKFKLKEWKNYNFSLKKLKANEFLISFCENKKLKTLLYFLLGTQSRTRTDTENSIGS